MLPSTHVLPPPSMRLFLEGLTEKKCKAKILLTKESLGKPETTEKTKTRTLEEI